MAPSRKKVLRQFIGLGQFTKRAARYIASPNADVLELLRTGELRAFIEYPRRNSKPRAIPSEYWRDEIERLNAVEKHPRNRRWVTQIVSFPGKKFVKIDKRRIQELIALLLQEHQTKDIKEEYTDIFNFYDVNADEFLNVRDLVTRFVMILANLDNNKRKYRVVVPASAWDDFCAQNKELVEQLDEENARSLGGEAEKRGRKPNEGWHEFWAELTMRIHEKGFSDNKKTIVDEMHEWAKTTMRPVPAKSTVESRIDELYVAKRRHDREVVSQKS